VPINTTLAKLRTEVQALTRLVQESIAIVLPPPEPPCLVPQLPSARVMHTCKGIRQRCLVLRQQLLVQRQRLLVQRQRLFTLHQRLTRMLCQLERM
jgi:hypothetical protein